MRHELPANYPDAIRRLRGSLELTRGRLAESLGVSEGTVRAWEAGSARPGQAVWQKILRAQGAGLSGLTYEPPADSSGEIRGSGSPYGHQEVAPRIDFSGDPESVRTVAEGERLGYGHLFNPGFATEISLVDPLPHQRIAVYERMLAQPRLRFLLADDAGAGKTIMAGLYIREMLSRRLISRILVVPPAGLLGNWRREMHTLFRLPFRIVSGPDARSGNPFVGPDSHLLVVSIDTLSGDKMLARLKEPDVIPYDLIIFDEAHKLSAHREPDLTVKKTDRYCLAEGLAGVRGIEPKWQIPWSPQHLILLTATPHMGKDFPYYCLWRLLDPEILATEDAFRASPESFRTQRFIRRTKEEMVYLDGRPIYPTRKSDTLSYELTQGEVGEQRLYDETTRYISSFYNKARILNRSAARFAMSIFQRRLASSTYALLRSFERRLAKLDRLIDDIESGRLKEDDLDDAQEDLVFVENRHEEMTADEEESLDASRTSESLEDDAMSGVTATSLPDLMEERSEVVKLLDLSRQVYERGDESKFNKLAEILSDARYRDEKLIIFTEHRDTLDFLLLRLGGIGFADQVAQIHGGMNYQERDEAVESFRKKIEEGGARYLVATDAAGEGINLQFAWLMVNYDIPWNPARLEQRMGRIHRYGQKRDPVIIMNLVAGATREGRVLKILLEKLEAIRKELGSDKVFDVIGRLFEGVSLRDYMEKVVVEGEDPKALAGLEGKLTKEQVDALADWEQSVYGKGGEIREELPRMNERIEKEAYCRLLPGYLQRFIEKACPRIGIEVQGDIDGIFSFRAREPGALDPFWTVLEGYSAEQQDRYTVHRPNPRDPVIFLHPGEPLFEHFKAHVIARLRPEALRGAVFIDPTVDKPYMFSLISVQVERKHRSPGRAQLLEGRLLGLKCDREGHVEECTIEHLMSLTPGTGLPVSQMGFVDHATICREHLAVYAQEAVARRRAEEIKASLAMGLSEREDFLKRGYAYQEAQLATMRSRAAENVKAGIPGSQADLDAIKESQKALSRQREDALKRLQDEIDLIEPGGVQFLAHALVLPSSDPEERKRHDKEVERLAMCFVRAYEEGRGAVVEDVCTAELARTLGLQDWPGFDLRSRTPDGEERDIEVKGRAQQGEIELSENEWMRACNLRDHYWLYVVYDCLTPQPKLYRVFDPFLRLVARAKGGVTIRKESIFSVAEEENVHG